MSAYDVSFIRRDGNSPTGNDWTAFMDEQRRQLEAGAAAGSRLIAVVPVATTSMWTNYGGGRTAGVLLYWEKP